jgi:MFS family permease
MRLDPARTHATVTALGVAQTVAWASTYYLPAVLAVPMAEDLGVSPVWVFAAFSMAMALSAIVGPAAGRRIDRRGGRAVLSATSLVFAGGLALMAASPSIELLFLAWAIVGIGMGAGLYEAAFAALARIYGAAARRPITGITLIAGFASTVGWPLSALMLDAWGWRGACLGWAALHLAVALPLNLILPAAGPPPAPASSEAPPAPPASAPPFAMPLLAFVFATTWFISTAMAAHLPGLLVGAGASPATAVLAGALIGPAQVAARLLEFGMLRRFHPLVSARLAAAAHPLAAVLLVAVGGQAACVFALLHGAGNGILTIAKGTLPLAIFGASGYGQRLGWLGAPARILQAGAPVIFGAALAAWGTNAIWLTAAIGAAATAALFALRR